MRLTELDAAFVKLTDDAGSFRDCESYDGAQGLRFDCPKCRQHDVLIFFRGVPEHITPGPGRWLAIGSGLDNIGLVPYEGHPKNSVQLTGGCNAHFMIIGGEVSLI